MTDSEGQKAIDMIRRYVALAIAEEREACAQIAEKRGCDISNAIAVEIRSRAS